MKQISFAQAEHQNKKKVTRHERFLAQMEALSPSYFPNVACKRGRPPIGLERMLRVYFLQQWYALADEALEDAIYDSQAMRDFIGIDLAIKSVPDATTLLRLLLEVRSLRPPGQSYSPKRVINHTGPGTSASSVSADSVGCTTGLFTANRPVELVMDFCQSLVISVGAVTV